MQITRLDAPRCRGGENPMWDPVSQRLYYIDNSGQKLHALDEATSATRTWDMPSVITTFVLREKGGAVVTLRTGLFFVDLDTGVLEPVHPNAGPQTNRYNDGKVDSRGRFLIGGSTSNLTDPQPDGGLFRLDPDHSLTRLDGDIHFSNGPCWLPDGGRFHFSDSWRNTVYAYDYDIRTGGLANRRTFVETGDLGVPDGATVDADGLYWVALYKGGKVAAYRPDGKLERTIDMPVSLVTSVMFGGPKLDCLYVTTIANGSFGEHVEEDAGYLYRIEGLGTTGLPEHRYAG